MTLCEPQAMDIDPLDDNVYVQFPLNTWIRPDLRRLHRKWPQTLQWLMAIAIQIREARSNGRLVVAGTPIGIEDVDILPCWDPIDPAWVEAACKVEVLAIDEDGCIRLRNRTQYVRYKSETREAQAARQARSRANRRALEQAGQQDGQPTAPLSQDVTRLSQDVTPKFDTTQHKTSQAKPSEAKTTSSLQLKLKPPDDVSFAVAEEVDEVLRGDLMRLGVNEPKLSSLLGNPTLTKSCLRALAAQPGVTSQAAWLVTAFERGGYTVPRSAADQAAADREALLQARAAARDREARERESASRAEAAEWEHLVAGLSPVALAAVEAEARDTLRPLVGRKLDKVPSDAPQIRAAMRELLRARASPAAG